MDDENDEKPEWPGVAVTHRARAAAAAMKSATAMAKMAEWGQTAAPTPVSPAFWTRPFSDWAARPSGAPLAPRPGPPRSLLHPKTFPACPTL